MNNVYAGIFVKPQSMLNPSGAISPRPDLEAALRTEMRDLDDPDDSGQVFMEALVAALDGEG